MPGTNHSAATDAESAVRILLVDDSAPFLRAARRHLDLEPGFTVLDTASSGTAAVVLTRELRPDVVLVDVSMPQQNGIETARQLKALDPAPAVILLTGHDTAAYRDAARRAGADAMLGKWNLSDEAPALIRALCRADARRGENAP